MGRVHYMLVEGLGEAKSWANAIRAQAGDDRGTSPRDEVPNDHDRAVSPLDVLSKSTWRYLPAAWSSLALARRVLFT